MEQCLRNLLALLLCTQLGAALDPAQPSSVAGQIPSCARSCLSSVLTSGTGIGNGTTDLDCVCDTSDCLITNNQCTAEQIADTVRLLPEICSLVFVHPTAVSSRTDISCLSTKTSGSSGNEYDSTTTVRITCSGTLSVTYTNTGGYSSFDGQDSTSTTTTTTKTSGTKTVSVTASASKSTGKSASVSTHSNTTVAPSHSNTTVAPSQSIAPSATPSATPSSGGVTSRTNVAVGMGLAGVTAFLIGLVL